LPRNKYPEETKEKIIDAGLRAFQEKGYEETTVLDIVANMDGLTRGAFYHHFKSKEEVLSAICERIFRNNNPFVKACEEKNLSGMEKLRKALKMNMVAQHTDFDIINSASKELYKSPTFFMWQMEFNVSLSHKYIQPLIKEGIADGSIKEQDAQILAELFIVLFSFWLGSMLFEGDRAYMEKKAIAIIEILEHFGLSIYDEEFDKLGDAFLDNMENAKI
jgi:AcrR family transcriptional regulator